MHEDCGYSYLGEQRFGRLTPQEVDMLQLGWLVKAEAREEALDEDGGGGLDKKSRQEYLEDYEKKHGIGGYGPQAQPA